MRSRQCRGARRPDPRARPRRAPAGRWHRAATPAPAADVRRSQPGAAAACSTSRSSTCRRCARAAGTVRLPGSKSISNRVLLLAGLSDGTTARARPARLRRHARDARRAARARLRRSSATATALRVTRPRRPAARCARRRCFLGNAGTAMRPLTAALALLAATQGGRFELSRRAAHARAADRRPGRRAAPLGCRIDYLGHDGYPPLRVRGRPAALRHRRADPRARRRVEPVPDRAAAGAAAGRRRAAPIVDRGRRRADLQALRRDHAEAAGALRHRRAARRLAALHHPAAAAATARRATSTSKATPRRRRTSSRWARSRAHGGAAAHRRRRQRFDPGRHPLRRRRAGDGRRRDAAAPGWLEVRRGALAAAGDHARLQPHPRRRDDAGGDGAVRRRHDAR